MSTRNTSSSKKTVSRWQVFYLKLRNPEVREHIRKSREEFLSGQSRPMSDFLAERGSNKKKRVGRRARP